MSLFTEMKQRLIKFETLHGLYLVPLSIIGLYVTIFHLEYVLHALAAIIFCYGLIEGLRKICYNPVKKEALKVLRRAKYIDDNTAKLKKDVPPSAVSNANVVS